MNFRYIFLTFLVYLNIQHCIAQSPYFRQITDREGLPSMTVYDIFQSQKGYIWIGTEAGIGRYDGVQFKTYHLKNSKGKSLTNIQEDSQGNIYTMNFAGQLFKLQKDSIIEIQTPKDLKKRVETYLIDQQDNLWLCADKVYFKQNNTQDWKVLKLPAKHFVKSIQQDTQGGIWILAYHNRIYQVNAQLQILQSIKTPDNLLEILVEEKSIKAIALEGNHFYNYDFQSKQWARIWRNIEDKIPDQVMSFVKDKEDNFWFLTFEGVVHYQTQSKTAHTFIKNVFISSFIQDREGNHWFTSLGEGLFVLSSLEGIHFNRNNSLLSFERVNCFTEDHLGNLYIGTNGNRIFYLDTQEPKLTLSYKLNKGDVECIFFDKNRKHLYVENDLVHIFDALTNKEIQHINLGNTPKDFAIFQDKYLISVAGNVSYIYPLNPTDKVPQFGIKEYENSPVLRIKRGRTVCVENTQQRFWIAYSDGLYFYEKGKNQEVKTPDNQSIIAISLQVDADNIVWVGTAQQGVFAIKNKKIIKHLDTHKGLISNFGKVVKDKGFLYIGTDKGLQVYHLKTGQSRIFNQEDGLPSNEIRDLIVQKDKIYLATNKGLSILNKDFSTTNHKPPLIYFTGLDIWDKAQKPRKNYQLEYNQNNLTIHFTGLAFRSGGKFRYKYRMKGLDKKWTYVKSSHNFARYSALPSGTYQFEVKAINEDGIESEKTVTVKINIAYPIWEKWWFIALIIVLVLGIVSTIFINRLRAIRRKNQMEKALGKATLESLKLQMNPHFLFNAMSAIQRYMIRNDAPKASNYLAQFSKLMRAVLENSRSEYISLEQEIEMLENYLTLQKLQHKGNFQYEIEVDETLDPEEIAIPPMFAQPFIENAIEHGIADLENEGLIQISFDLKADFIMLSIQDNGIGLAKSQENKQKDIQNHQSLATQITKERINLYQKSLKKNIFFEIKSSEQGTEVVFHLPYQNL